MNTHDTPAPTFSTCIRHTPDGVTRDGKLVPLTGETAATKTPRTNAASYNGYGYLFNESKKLEMELAEARAERDAWKDTADATMVSLKAVEPLITALRAERDEQCRLKQNCIGELETLRAQLAASQNAQIDCGVELGKVQAQLVAHSGVIARLKEAMTDIRHQAFAVESDERTIIATATDALALTPGTYADALNKAEKANSALHEIVAARVMQDSVSCKLREELAFLRSYVGDETLKSDFRTVGDMRNALTDASSELAELRGLLARVCANGGSMSNELLAEARARLATPPTASNSGTHL